MELNLSIPALLFPAISLSMLAYNARYLAIAALIRQLYKEYLQTPERGLQIQVRQLKKRLTIIKNMQAVAILSFLFSAITMFLIYIEMAFWANFFFGMSLLMLMTSLILSLIEVQLSTKSLNTQLRNMDSTEESISD